MTSNANLPAIAAPAVRTSAASLFELVLTPLCALCASFLSFYFALLSRFERDGRPLRLSRVSGSAKVTSLTKEQLPLDESTPSARHLQAARSSLAILLQDNQLQKVPLPGVQLERCIWAPETNYVSEPVLARKYRDSYSTYFRSAIQQDILSKPTERSNVSPILL